MTPSCEMLESVDFKAEYKAIEETLKIIVGKQIQDAALAVVGRLVKGRSSAGCSSQPDEVSAFTKLLAEDKDTGQRLEQVLSEACTTEQFVDHFSKASKAPAGNRHPSDEDIEKLVYYVKAMPLYPFCKRHADSKDFYVLDNFNAIRQLWKKAD